MTSFVLKFRKNVHNATAITTGSANQRPNTLCIHILLPAIETTDVIGNTDNKQVKRNMSEYFQRMFMLFSLSFGYLFYDTYSYFL